MGPEALFGARLKINPANLSSVKTPARPSWPRLETLLL